jgi:4-hydroxy-tetrahydrodipicolinate synthase
MFTGSIVALVSPFKNGSLDVDAYKQLLDWHLESGTHGLVPCGTTGESPTLARDEYEQLFRIAVEKADGKIPVICGTGGNETQRTVKFNQIAKECGADGTLVVTPYHNKPSQEGLYRHYMTVADAVDIPIVLYNVPGRTAVNLQPETVERLSAHPNIVAVKEASGNVAQTVEIARRCDITILSGDDALNVAIMANGGKGCISVLANVAPRENATICEKMLNGDTAGALEIHKKLFALTEALFIETNPVPVKTLLSAMGRIQPELRLPLWEMAAENKAVLEQAARDCGVLA